MKTTSACRPVLALLTGFILTGCATTPTAPEKTADGLVLVPDTQADLVYRRPGAKFAGYTKIMLIEPQVAFRKNWQTDANFQTPMHRVSDSDMAKMISEGKKLLVQEFAQALRKAGYTLVAERGADVLAVKASILDLDVAVPDSNNEIGTYRWTFTQDTGSATLAIELYDSVTGQLVARAFDQESGDDNGYSWRIPRNQMSNTIDARIALDDWADMLVKGLARAKAVEAAK